MHKSRKFEGDDLRKFDPKFQEPKFSEYLNCIKKLEEWVRQKYKKPLYALAIRWALDKGISSALWGARHPTQLDGLDEIWDWKLNESDMLEIDKIIDDSISDPISPKFMAPPSRNP